MKLTPCALALGLAVAANACVIHVPAKHAYGHEFRDGWVLLGKQEVGFQVDHDVIRVTASEGRFRAIGLHVSGAPLELLDMTVTFGDGEVFQPKVRHDFRQGSTTRRIDLPGGQRVIKQVDFTYRSPNPEKGRANIELFGQA